MLAGTDDATLDSGVGHVDASRWPDQGGVDVLAAHNVTFFTGLPRLRDGAEITVSGRCRSWTYKVVRRSVVNQGTPVLDTPAPTLVLVTCWPTDALYYTAQRFVVTATLTATSGSPSPTTPPAHGHLAATAIPAGLSAAALGPGTVGARLGTMRTAGDAEHSPETLNAGNQAIRLLAAAHLSQLDNNLDWWRTIAPAVPFAAGFVLARPQWTSWLDESVSVTRDGSVTVQITASVRTPIGARRVAVDAEGNHFVPLHLVGVTVRP